ncbi:tripartite tricarboxylate transporter TctB family protein [Tuberibacillus sp. Marseille-P3662]|uniref:tripartite tricarboxylate transporter TctB family protein n=1 Tax=Tuberibacillus sp. Marseille-P3662 TaxID=1965358 RepID=UPI000A1C8AFA|nr:tripartite tricarboxylate transporter TctB family protein [Tuberibacillus sp. Marseille-P3662]
MIFKRYGVPIFFILVGVAFLVGTLTLSEAPTGDPNAPKYFPAFISIFLIIISTVYFIKELISGTEANEELKALLKNRTPFLIIGSLVLGLLYTMVFQPLGFLISTILFLGFLLCLVNGVRTKRKWMVNIVVAVLFTWVIWYGFAKLLHVSLP